ncbi:MAG: thioredoxin-disulfide reductase [Syntrophaceticus sp.]
MEIYDLLIIGGGPAGLAAGIYGSRARLKTVILEKGSPGGQAATTEELENYPGFPGGTTGPGLMKAMADHARSFGTDIKKENVVDLDLGGEIKVIKTKGGTEYRARAVVLATGAHPRSLNIKGEKELIGKGVSYCATCDADFFEDLEVVVVGSGDAAVEEAIYLTKFASKVSIIVIHDQGILDCNKLSAERAFANPKIHWIWSSVLEEIKGDGIVESVVIKNLKTGQLTEMETNGVFFFVGTVPNTDFLQGKVDLDDTGYIITNERMETSVPGVYAAGDVRVKYLRQVVTAAADGAVAAVAAERYLAEEEFFKEQVSDFEGTVVAVFWSPQNEKSINAVACLEKVAQELGDQVKLVKIDVSRSEVMLKRYQVSAVPTVLYFVKGEVVGRNSGEITVHNIKKQIADLQN